MNKARKILLEKEIIVDLYEYLETRIEHLEGEKAYYEEKVAEEFPDGEITDKNNYYFRHSQECTEKIKITNQLQEKILKLM